MKKSGQGSSGTASASRFDQSEAFKVVIMQNPNRCNFENEAIVDEIIRPGRAGRVRYQASWWYARCEHNVILYPEEVVCVIGLHNITLLVEPIRWSTPGSADASNLYPFLFPVL